MQCRLNHRITHGKSTPPFRAPPVLLNEERKKHIDKKSACHCAFPMYPISGIPISLFREPKEELSQRRGGVVRELFFLFMKFLD